MPVVWPCALWSWCRCRVLLRDVDGRVRLGRLGAGAIAGDLHQMCEAVCAVSLRAGAAAEVPLPDAYGSLSFRACVSVLLQAAAGCHAKCLWQCSIWSVGAGAMLPTHVVCYLGFYASVVC